MWCSRNVCIRYPYFILGILHIKNVWVFVVGAFVAMLGMYFFQTQCWALVTDVIDDMEVQTGNRDDGTIYGIYSFSRKIGQAIAGGLSGWALGWIGYNELAAGQTEAVAMVFTTWLLSSQQLSIFFVD